MKEEFEALSFTVSSPYADDTEIDVIDISDATKIAEKALSQCRKEKTRIKEAWEKELELKTKHVREDTIKECVEIIKPLLVNADKNHEEYLEDNNEYAMRYEGMSIAYTLAIKNLKSKLEE